jgi:hypothetical protein
VSQSCACATGCVARLVVVLVWTVGVGSAEKLCWFTGGCCGWEGDGDRCCDFITANRLCAETGKLGAIVVQDSGAAGFRVAV